MTGPRWEAHTLTSCTDMWFHLLLCLNQRWQQTHVWICRSICCGKQRLVMEANVCSAVQTLWQFDNWGNAAELRLFSYSLRRNLHWWQPDFGCLNPAIKGRYTWLWMRARGQQKQDPAVAWAFLGCRPLKSFLAEASIGHFGAPLSGQPIEPGRINEQAYPDATRYWWEFLSPHRGFPPM